MEIEKAKQADGQTPAKDVDPLEGLDDEERRYVNVYLNEGNHNHRRTARLIGRKSPLYRPRVREAIDLLLSYESPSEQEVLSRLGEWMFFDPSEHGDRWRKYDPDLGIWKANWSYIREKGVGRFIKSVKNDRSGNELIEWHSQTEIAHLIAKALGMTTETSRSLSVNLHTASEEELRRIVEGK